MKYEEKRQPISWSESEGQRRVEEKVAAQETPKPYTVPEGYKAPTMGEQWLYATRRHPYYRHMNTQTASACLHCARNQAPGNQRVMGRRRYGYALVALVGLGLYAAATINRVETVHREARKPK